jgi:hypothetical protein
MPPAAAAPAPDPAQPLRAADAVPHHVTDLSPQRKDGSTMAMRSGVYIVPTHRWYIERTVWLIAGCVLIVSTTLAAVLRPVWVVGVMATGLASIVVALTGFCVVGNVLRLFGFTPMLARKEPAPGGLYLMQTDKWYLERRIYLAVGININVASALVLAHSTWWLLFPAFVGVAMVWFAVTGFCIMANGLYWLGAEPRLAPEGKSCPPVGAGAPGHARA